MTDDGQGGIRQGGHSGRARTFSPAGISCSMGSWVVKLFAAHFVAVCGRKTESMNTAIPSRSVSAQPASRLVTPAEVVEVVGEACPVESYRGQRVLVIVPDLGVLIPQDASPTVRALCRCLADVLRRVPQGPDLTYITPTEAGSLLNWDAETYRAALNAQ